MIKVFVDFFRQKLLYLGFEPNRSILHVKYLFAINIKKLEISGSQKILTYGSQLARRFLYLKSVCVCGFSVLGRSSSLDMKSTPILLAAHKPDPTPTKKNL
jgi:hypothetical protein